MSIFTKARLKTISLVSFILTLITGGWGFQKSMMVYGTPEMMSRPDPFGAGKLMIAALVFLIITIVSFVFSKTKKK
jgi:hypothetical protein